MRGLLCNVRQVGKALAPADNFGMAIDTLAVF